MPDCRHDGLTLNCVIVRGCFQYPTVKRRPNTGRAFQFVDHRDGVAQSEQAFLALAQGKGPAAPAVRILEYKEMKPFFVVDDDDAP